MQIPPRLAASLASLAPRGDGPADIDEEEEGQGMVEYALILVLIAIVVIVILAVVGHQVSNVYSNISSGLGT